MYMTSYKGDDPVFVSVTAVEKKRSLLPRLVVKDAFRGPALPTQLADCREDVDVSWTSEGSMSTSPIRPLHTKVAGGDAVEVRYCRLQPSKGSPGMK